MQLKEKQLIAGIIQNFRKAAKEKGFKKTSMDKLAAEMGISKKTVYKYFPAKKDLVAACLKEINNEMDDSVKEIFAAAQPTQELMITALTNIFMQMSANASMLQDLQRYYPEQWISFEEGRSDRIKLAERFIEKGIAAEQFNQLNARVVLYSYLSAVGTIINPSFLKTHQIEFNKAYESLIALFMRGLLSASREVDKR